MNDQYTYRLIATCPNTGVIKAHLDSDDTQVLSRQRLVWHDAGYNTRLTIVKKQKAEDLQHAR
jgi:hypothetical protein